MMRAPVLGTLSHLSCLNHLSSTSLTNFIHGFEITLFSVCSVQMQ